MSGGWDRLRLAVFYSFLTLSAMGYSWVVVGWVRESFTRFLVLVLFTLLSWHIGLTWADLPVEQRGEE
jgi:hypothetical protein